MPSVMLTKGKYWVGDPKMVLQDWKPNANHTYKCGPYTFHAFKFGKNYVAAIPVDALEYSTDRNLANGPLMTFQKDTVFYEQYGMGKLGGVELGVIGDELKELIDEHDARLPHMTGTDNPIDFPKSKKTKPAPNAGAI